MSSQLKEQSLNSQIIQGGEKAHIARRVIHVSMIFIPLIYYYLLTPLFSTKILHLGILFFIFCVFLVEKARIRYRFVMFAQRFYEASSISAFAWTMLSMGLLLFFSPSVAYSMAIVATCAFVDPVMGEMRLLKIKPYWTMSVGVLIAALVWGLCAHIYSFALWWVFVMPFISVAAEWPSLKWIDDNALMILIPLLIVIAVVR